MELRFPLPISVLYVEDDPSTREEIIFALNPMVQSLLVAENGEEGKKLFYEHPIDLIITDIQMPVMDGLAMITQVKSTHPKIPVIVVTAFNDTHYLFKAIELGVSHYLNKPTNLKQLRSKIEELAEQIIDKKQAKWQAKLLQQYKTAIDETMTICKLDSHLDITYINAKYSHLSGYRSDEIIGMNYLSLLSLKEPNKKLDAFKHSMENGGIWHETIENRSKNGDHFILDTTAFALFESDGTTAEYVLIGDDITEVIRYRDFLEIELVKNRNSLNETLHFLQQYQNALQKGTAMCHIDLNGNILKVNQTFSDLLEYPHGKLLQSNHSAICAETKTVMEEIIARLGRNGTVQKELAYRSLEGKQKTFHSTFVPIVDIRGNIVEVLSMHHDITELITLNREITLTQHEVLSALGEAAENKSEETGSHVKRVAAYSYFLARKYGLNEADARLLEMAAPMHDVGKIAIPDAILHKPGKLTLKEMEIIQTHAEKGYRILAHSERPLLKCASIVALQHHEKFDGSGYPSGLKGEAIDIMGRIVAVADVFDSLGTKRSYKPAWELDTILEYFKAQRGIHFDPELVDILLGNIDEILTIRNLTADEPV